MTNAAPWLTAAVSYIPQWLEYQIERYRRLGCAVAIAHATTLVYEQAFGVAVIRTGKPLTPRHRFRAASHAKSFTAAGIMRLRENGKIGLDDTVGRYVSGLHKELAKARISELLSHSAVFSRDGLHDFGVVPRARWFALSLGRWHREHFECVSTRGCAQQNQANIFTPAFLAAFCRFSSSVTSGMPSLTASSR